MDYSKMFTLVEVPKGYIIKKYKGKEKNVIIPGKINDKDVVAVGELAFKGKDIEEVSLPSTLIVIGERAFFECKNLKKVTLENKVAMDRYVFSGCDLLADENGFVVVGNILFDYLGQSKEIVIPDNVKIIDDRAFSRITKSLESVEVPETVEELRCNAFLGCVKLVSVKINPEKTRINPSAFDDCKGLLDEEGYFIINGYLCAYRGDSVETLTLNSKIKRIGAQALGYQSKLKEVIIPEGVEIIDNNAFYFHSSLKKVRIPKSVKSIEKDSFKGCDNISIEASADSYAIRYAKENNLKYVES